MWFALFNHKKMPRISVIFLLFLHKLFVKPVHGSFDVCLVSNKELGRCLPQSDCLYPKGSDCASYGRHEMVCCEMRTCLTADGHDGMCVKVDRCPKIMKMLREKRPLANDTVEYLKKSECKGTSKISVCCDDDYNVVPSKVSCGRMEAEARIYGGKKTSLTDFSWVALLEYRVNGTIVTNCAGSLISPRYVLTAAHCIANDRVLVSVRLGEHNTRTEIDCEKVPNGKYCNSIPISVKVAHAIQHPQYNDNTMKNDIGLLQLTENVTYTEFISPVCLPLWEPEPALKASKHVLMDPEAHVEDPIVTAVGWGATETSIRSEVRLQVHLPMVKKEECQERFREMGARLEIWNSQICAGGTAGEDTCIGDSGGPLMIPFGFSWHLVGVVSYGPENCGTNVPAIYTNVYYYLKWILRTMELRR